MEPSVSEFVESVQAMLSTLRAIDPSGSASIGADGHAYVCAPVATQDALYAFEARHRIALPTTYRAFLGLIGDGGAGPYYGLSPMGHDEDGPWTEGLVGDPSLPFPFDRAWNLPDEDLERLNREDDVEEITARYWRPTDGALPLCTEGCALRHWLVVTGPLRGNVWRDSTADFGGWSPIVDAHGAPVTFARWYLAWLEQTLAKARAVS